MELLYIKVVLTTATSVEIGLVIKGRFTTATTQLPHTSMLLGTQWAQSKYAAASTI